MLKTYLRASVALAVLVGTGAAALAASNGERIQEIAASSAGSDPASSALRVTTTVSSICTP